MSIYDFDNAVAGWRDDEARAGRDPVGDAMAARADARFLRNTYCDVEDECTCRFAGDEADASDCDAHGGRSTYNHGQGDLFDVEPIPAAAVRLVESVEDLMLDEGVA